MKMLFTCSDLSNPMDKWEGRIERLDCFGSHYEMRIESRSGITVFFGRTSYGGNFACMPDFQAGCHLDYLNNEYYNSDKLRSVLNRVDSITVSRALNVADKNIIKARKVGTK